jgi:predicted outer membrane repeat protein
MHAEGNGGAAYLRLASLGFDFSMLTVTECEAGGCGGALCLEGYDKSTLTNNGAANCWMTLENSIFHSCRAKYGGAIFVYLYSDTEPVSFSHVFFDNCSARESGGAIYIENDTLPSGQDNVIENSIFEKCSALGYGGALCLNERRVGNYNLKISKCAFYSCRAGFIAAMVWDTLC